MDPRPPEKQPKIDNTTRLIPFVENSAQMENLRTTWDEWRKNYESELPNRTQKDQARINMDTSEWIYNKHGQEIMVGLISKISEAVFRGEFSNTPASHDLRHYLCDLAESTVTIDEEMTRTDRHGWLVATVIPSMWHDMGKLAEAKLNREHVSGIKGKDHAIIAADSLNNFLEANAPDMPAELKSQMIYAVLTHQQGISVEGAEMAAIVSSGDRAQLVGVEGCRRELVHDAGIKKAIITEHPDRKLAVALPLPDSPEDLDFAAHAMFYARNLYHQATDAAQERANQSKLDTAIFVWQISSPEARQIYFAAEMRTYEDMQLAQDLLDYENSLDGKTFNQVFTYEMWLKIKNSDQGSDFNLNNMFANMDLNEILSNYLWRRHANPKEIDPVTGDTIDIESNLIQQLEALTPEAQQRWKVALAVSLHKIKRQENKTMNLLSNIIDDEDKPTFFRTMAAMLFSAMGEGKISNPEQ